MTCVTIYAISALGIEHNIRIAKKALSLSELQITSFLVEAWVIIVLGNTFKKAFLGSLKDVLIVRYI